MSTANHDHTYSLILSSGTAWDIGSCEGADDGVSAWVDEFAAYLGLEQTARASARGLRFGRVLDDNGQINDSLSSFRPSVPLSFPPTAGMRGAAPGLFSCATPRSRMFFAGFILTVPR